MAWWDGEESAAVESGAGGGLVAPASHELFEDWLYVMSPRVAGFADFELPTNFDQPHFTGAAMGELGHVILALYPDEWSLGAGGDHLGWVDGCVRYIGETFIRNCGGRWDYETGPDAVDRGRPVVVLDVEVPTPISPHMLMRGVLERRDPGLIGRVFAEELARAEAWAVKAGHGRPREWQEPLPPEVEAEKVRMTAEWVDSLEDGAARFVAAYPDLGPWDFSLESLDRLEGLLAPFASVAEFEASGEFREMVLRYFGVTVQRLYGGYWEVRPEDPEVKDDFFAGRPVLFRDHVVAPMWSIPEVAMSVSIRGKRSLRKYATEFAGDPQ